MNDPLDITLDLMNGVDIAWRRTHTNLRVPSVGFERDDVMSVLPDRYDLCAVLLYLLCDLL
jgi:hypothetical protein